MIADHPPATAESEANANNPDNAGRNRQSAQHRHQTCRGLMPSPSFFNGCDHPGLSLRMDVAPLAATIYEDVSPSTELEYSHFESHV